MSIAVLDEKHPVARKRHECNACRGFIGVGDRYYSQRCAEGGYLWTYRSHLLCEAIVNDEYLSGGAIDYEDIGPDFVCERLSAIFDAVLSSGVSS